MKKFLRVLAAMVMSLTLLAAASCDNVVSGQSVSVIIPDGAPAVAMAKLINGGNIGKSNTQYEIVTGVDSVASNISSGKADIAIMPINVAAKLYNKGISLKLVSANIAGCLYLIGTETVESVSALIGKVVCVIGSGGTPDILFRYLLGSANVSFESGSEAVEGKVVVNYVTADSEVIAQIKLGNCEYAIVGEPQVTAVTAATETVVALDLQAEWEEYNDGLKFTQAGVVVSSGVYNNLDIMTDLLKTLDETPDWVVTRSSRLKSILSGAGSNLTMDFTEEIVNRCNIVCLPADENKADIESFLNVFYNYDATTIGGKLPDDGFYFSLQDLENSSESASESAE